jgi:hypothetical protein
MVVSGFGPYHRPVHADAPAQRAVSSHTMGDATYTWFWCNPSGGRVARATTTTSKMPIFESMLNYRIIH